MSTTISNLSPEEIADFMGETPANIDTTLGTETPIVTDTTEVPPTNIPKTDPVTPSSTEEPKRTGELPSLEQDLVDDEPKVDDIPVTPTLDYSKYYEMMVENGLWSKVTDGEGKPLDTIELDAEQFQELSLKQAEWKAEELLQTKEEEFGTQYTQLLEYVKNGGKVEDLASSYAEEKDLDSFNPEDTDHAKELIESYYKALGWKDKKITDYIEMLEDKADDSLKEEAVEAKDKLLESVKESREQALEQQKAQQQLQKDSRDRFNKNIREAIYKIELPERDKKSLDSFFFDHKHPSPQGKKSDYALKIEGIQQDPSKFTKFLNLIKNFDTVEEKKVTELEVNKKTYKLFKEGVTSNTANAQNPNKQEEPKKIQLKNPFLKA